MIPKAPFDKESKVVDKSKTKGKHSFECGGTTFLVDDKYEYIKQIGHGAYGIVCSALNKSINTKVAIKKVLLRNFCSTNLNFTLENNFKAFHFSFSFSYSIMFNYN